MKNSIESKLINDFDLKLSSDELEKIKQINQLVLKIDYVLKELNSMSKNQSIKLSIDVNVIKY